MAKYVSQSILNYYDGKIKEYIRTHNAVASVATYNDLPTENLFDGMKIFVIDASADTTVSSGWAVYRYIASTTSWLKIAEGESLDLVLDWDNIQNKPNMSASNHTHGNISNSGALTEVVHNDQTDEDEVVAVAANTPMITGANGAIQKGAFGTTANTFCEGNDSRLSDAREPTNHASSKVTAMTSYSKPNSLTSGHEAIEATDSLDTAIGKLEYKIDSIETLTTSDIDALFA